MGNSFLLIIVGLLLMYVVLSDRFYCIEGALACLFGSGEVRAGAGAGASVRGGAGLSGIVPAARLTVR